MLGLVIGGTGQAPLLLYPSTPSLPAGLYIKIGDSVERGSIVAFPVPEAALAYRRSIGRRVDPDFLFLKPVIALPGDLVCNDVDAGLWLNGRKVALDDSPGSTKATRCRSGRTADASPRSEVFTFADHAPNSFDGRYYGPIERSRMVGVYRMIWKNPWTR